TTKKRKMDSRQRNTIIKHFTLICHNIPTQRSLENFSQLINDDDRRYLDLLPNDYQKKESLLNIILQTERNNIFQELLDFLWQFNATEGNLGEIVARTYKNELIQVVNWQKSSEMHEQVGDKITFVLSNLTSKSTPQEIYDAARIARAIMAITSIPDPVMRSQLVIKLVRCLIRSDSSNPEVQVELCRALNSLLEKDYRTFKDEGGVTESIELLSSPYPEVAYHACDLFTKIAPFVFLEDVTFANTLYSTLQAYRHDMNFIKLISKILAIMIHGIGSPIQPQYLVPLYPVFNDLIWYNDREVIVNVCKSFVDIFDDSETDTNDFLSHILNYGWLPYIVPLVASSSKELSETSLTALMNLTYTPRWRRTTTEATSRCIKTVVDLKVLEYLKPHFCGNCGVTYLWVSLSLLINISLSDFRQSIFDAKLLKRVLQILVQPKDLDIERRSFTIISGIIDGGDVSQNVYLAKIGVVTALCNYMRKQLQLHVTADRCSSAIVKHFEVIKDTPIYSTLRQEMKEDGSLEKIRYIIKMSSKASIRARLQGLHAELASN
ncbi:Importin subunit alpha-1a, partial [Trichoplax sp. H2]